MLALQLLPPNSCGGLVVITDGVINIPDVNTLDTLLNQLRTKTISLSFIQVRIHQPFDVEHIIPVGELLVPPAHGPGLLPQPGAPAVHEPGHLWRLPPAGAAD